MCGTQRDATGDIEAYNLLVRNAKIVTCRWQCVWPCIAKSMCLPCLSMPQDKPRIYYPRIGEDLIDHATEMGADVATFDISQLSSSEITNITLTGICVSGETRFSFSCISLSIVSVFQSFFFYDVKWFLQSVQRLALPFAKIHILKQTACLKYSTWPNAMVCVVSHKVTLFHFMFLSSCVQMPLSFCRRWVNFRFGQEYVLLYTSGSVLQLLGDGT